MWPQVMGSRCNPEIVSVPFVAMRPCGAIFLWRKLVTRDLLGRAVATKRLASFHERGGTTLEMLRQELSDEPPDGPQMGPQMSHNWPQAHFISSVLSHRC